ncbi:MAG: TIGR04282 family arsenosugar biosynthesis glycosyltransferase [Myxococcota bacterium]
MSRGWLSVFAKAPRPGQVKTRFTPPLSPEDAASLYAAMLTDVLRASAVFARRLALEPILHFDPPEAARVLERFASAAYRLVPQRGSGLAERMANAFEEAAAVGAERVVLRGSDSPGLDFQICEEAIARLDAGDDVVLTPDQGGGYALIALKEPHRELFALTLSTRSVFAETVALARAKGLVVSSTRGCFDLDVAADLARLDEIGPPESSVLCPETVQIVRDFRARGVL